MKKIRKYVLFLLAMLIFACGLAGLLLWPHSLGLKQGVDYAYSVALVGDTQMMAWQYPENLSQIYDWILDNQKKYNIQYVIGLGDLTDRGIEYYANEYYHSDAKGNFRTVRDEWIDAADAVRKLNDRIPYTLNIGNHDDAKLYRLETDEYDCSMFMPDYFNEAFHIAGSSVPNGYDYMPYTVSDGGTYGFYDDAHIENTWRRCWIGTQEYLILTIGYLDHKDEAIMTWAENLIRENEDCTVILSTHSYLDKNGEPVNSLRERLVLPYKNVELVVCGHANNQSIVFNRIAKQGENPVTELMVNPQELRETGVIAILYFTSEGEQVGLECYSTVTDRCYGRENQFRIRAA